LYYVGLNWLANAEAAGLLLHWLLLSVIVSSPITMGALVGLAPSQIEI